MTRPLPAWGLGIAAVVFALDQLTKWWIIHVVENPLRILEITPFFNIVLVRNRGVSFGMMAQDEAWGKWLLVVLALAIAGGLLVWLFRARGTWVAVALGLIIGGAAGNVLDRFRFGGVTDFLDLHWGDVYHWPAFNLADSAITVGVVILLADALIGRGGKN